MTKAVKVSYMSLSDFFTIFFFVFGACKSSDPFHLQKFRKYGTIGIVYRD